VTRSADLAGHCTTAVDATARDAVVDLLKRAGLTCQLMSVIITRGEMQRLEKGYYMVPKRDLMAGMQVRLERGN